MVSALEFGSLFWHCRGCSVSPFPKLLADGWLGAFLPIARFLPWRPLIPSNGSCRALNLWLPSNRKRGTWVFQTLFFLKGRRPPSTKSCATGKAPAPVYSAPAPKYGSRVQVTREGPNGIMWGSMQNSAWLEVSGMRTTECLPRPTSLT